MFFSIYRTRDFMLAHIHDGNDKCNMDKNFNHFRVVSYCHIKDEPQRKIMSSELSEKHSLYSNIHSHNKHNIKPKTNFTEQLKMNTKMINKKMKSIHGFFYSNLIISSLS